MITAYTIVVLVLFAVSVWGGLWALTHPPSQEPCQVCAIVSMLVNVAMLAWGCYILGTL